MELEKRYFQEAEMRVEGESEKKITGYAAVFNRQSENLGGFTEIIRPGAFRKALDSDVRALFNHDSNYVLGRTTNGTLELEENQTGLKFTATPPDTQWARDLIKSIERGDINQCSFSFSVGKDGEKWTEKKDLALREILEVNYVGDVGPVTFPAYPQTSVQARSIITEAGLNFDDLTALFVRAQRGLTLTDADHDLIKASIQTLESYMPGEQETLREAVAQLEGVKRELELLKHT